MIEELDRVVLTVDVPDAGLKAGDVGIVVHLYQDGLAYVVEFITLDGETIAVETLEREQVRKIHKGEIANARPVFTL